MSASTRRSRCGGSWTAWHQFQKKSVCAAEQDRPDVATAHADWAHNQAEFDTPVPTTIHHHPPPSTDSAFRTYRCASRNDDDAERQMSPTEVSSNRNPT